MQLYNTKTRRKEQFTPAAPGRVTMYVCGPTVYSYAHIGNARPAVVFDVLARLLRYKYAMLTYARNITDIDDKINAAAVEEGVPISEVAERYTRSYHEDLAALGVAPPDIEPRVTTHIDDILTMITKLLKSGHAYEAESHVLFDVPSFPEYGALSHRAHDELLAGARVEVAPYKRDPSDFVLWKPSSVDQPGWDSPWGRGRPGWHIECSAMIAAHLGETIDIHGGGNDLVFPHHENEIAQSHCAHGGKPLSRYWVHNGFVNVSAEKMSKSLGNVLLVRDLLAQVPAEAIRYTLLSAHYRAPLDWTEATVRQSKAALDTLYQSLRELAEVVAEDDPRPPDAFVRHLEDDLNTPRALAELFALARAANKSSDDRERTRLKGALLASGRLLGLLQQDPKAWFGIGKEKLDVEYVERLVAERDAARAAKDFALADRLRDELAEMGVVLEDGAGGTRWRIQN